MPQLEQVEAAQQRVPQAEFIEMERPAEMQAEFHVTDERSANWVLRKLAEARMRVSKALEWAAHEEEAGKNEEEHLMARFGSELQEFAARAIEGGKKKSLSLPAGTVGFRSSPEKIEVKDDDAYIEWVERSFPGALNVTLSIFACGHDIATIRELAQQATLRGLQSSLTVKPDKNEVNLHCKNTGELPDGCELVPAQDKFYVK